MFTLIPKNFLNSLNICEQIISVNILTQNQTYIIECYTPGVSKENLELTFEPELLTIKIKNIVEIDNSHYIKQEFCLCNTQRTIHLKEADFSSSESTYINGKLTIKVNKKLTSSNEIKIQ